MKRSLDSKSTDHSSQRVRVEQEQLDVQAPDLGLAQSPMALLDLETARRIGDYLSRQACVHWSRCCRQLHALVSQCCYLRLTELQAGVVRSVLALRLADWVTARNKVKFPAKFVVATGTSTGKTAIMLACAAQMLERGQRVLIAVELRLISQWLAEYDKFAAALRLPPLLVIDARDAWLGEYAQRGGRCLVVAPRLYASHNPAKMGPQTAASIRRAVTALRSVEWDVVLCDDITTLPHLLRSGPRYGVVFNASLGSAAVNNHQQDGDLGRLPELRVESYRVPAPAPLPHIANAKVWHEGYFNRFLNKYVPGSWAPCQYLSRKAELDAALAQRHAEYARWLARCAGRKTLVVTHDELVAPRDQWGFAGRKVMIDDVVCDDTADLLQGMRRRSLLQTLPKKQPAGTIVLRGGESTQRKAELIARFQAADEGQLWASANFVGRGFNLPCDALVIFDCDQRITPQTLLQIIGRVRRVQAQNKQVRCCLISTNPWLWTLLAYLNLPTTTAILQKTQEHKSLAQVRAEVGPIDDKDGCLSFVVSSK